MHSNSLVPDAAASSYEKARNHSASFDSGGSYLGLGDPPAIPTMTETKVNGQTENIAVPQGEPETPDPYDVPPYHHSPCARDSQDNGELLRQMAILSHGSIHGPMSMGNDMTPDELVQYLLKHNRRHFVIEYNQIKTEECNATFNISRLVLLLLIKFKKILCQFLSYFLEI